MVKARIEITTALGRVPSDIRLQAAAELLAACKRGHQPSCEIVRPPEPEERNLEADMETVMGHLEEMCKRGDEVACLISEKRQD